MRGRRKEKREEASVRRGLGTRTIYLYTIDWAVCSHRKEKVEDAVRD